MGKSLLDDLSDECGCQYLSDLKYVVEPMELSRHIDGIRTGKYQIHEWVAAARYLTGCEKYDSDDEREIKEFIDSALLKFCEKTVLK